MSGAEPKQPRLFIFGEFHAGLLMADHRRQNDDALLAFADITAQPQPAVEAGDVRGLGPLAMNKQAVAPRVLVKPGHQAEIVLERVALTLVQSLHETIESVFAELFSLFCGHRHGPPLRAPLAPAPCGWPHSGGALFRLRRSCRPAARFGPARPVQL